MATLLDIGLLENFGIIFPFLLVFSITLAVLNYFEALKDNKALQATIAVALAFMTLFSKIAVKTIMLMAPWFVIMFVLAVLGVVLFMTVGYTKENIQGTLKSKEYAKIFGYLILSIVLIIGIGSLSFVVSEEKGFLSLTNETTDISQAEGESAGFFQILVDPKVLGMIMLLLIAVVTMFKLTEA